MATMKIKIVNGPSKFDVMAAMFVGTEYEMPGRVQVTFECMLKNEKFMVSALINGVIREPSKDMYNHRGSGRFVLTGDGITHGVFRGADRYWHYFTALYSIKTRKGELELGSPKKDFA